MQAELERRGVVTASLTMMTEITAKVRPPRALEVPYPLGFPLGAPGDAPLQRRILSALLRILERDEVPILTHLSEVEPAL